MKPVFNIRVMNDIYDILSKHFLGETTSDEEKLISEFKDNKSAEYKMLKRLWEMDGKAIEVKEFDLKKAWLNIENAAKKPKTKVISFYSYLQRIAVAAMIVISVSVASYWLVNRGYESKIVVADNHVRGEKVTLSDGTVVWLNKDSQISYPKKFKENQRVVTLEGEAFFEVTPDKHRPFIVKMDRADVTVLGTSFNIDQDSLDTEVTVKTGRVRVAANDINKSVVITPGFSSTVADFKIEKYQTVNPNYLSWKTGEFAFNNTPVEVAVRDLNTFYDVKIDFEDHKLDCNLTMRLNNESIEDVVEMLELVCDIDLVKENNVYKIKLPTNE